MSWWTKLLGGADKTGPAEAAKTVREGKKSTPMEEAQRRIREAGESGATTLNLSGLGLDTLPPALADLTGLETLNLSYNPLKEWPDWLARLGKLRTLYLNRCGLRVLPAWIARLERLETLSLYDNQLRDLPPELAQTAALSTISLGGNAFADFPAVLLACPRLTQLFIHDNRLTCLPAAIDQLAGLTWLNIDGSQCAALPESLGNLGALQHLNVANNGLRSLPESLAALHCLETLIANDNRLSALPNGIAKCQKLAFVDLANNQLDSLPPDLAALPLTDLSLQGNPALGLSDALLGEYVPSHKQDKTNTRDPQGILAAYYALQSKDGLALNEVKLVLVGRGFAGKTSLVRRLVHGDFKSDQPQTLGIDIQPWRFALDKTSNDKQNQVKVNIWDFAGQVITHATHQFFLSESSVYILALTGRDDMHRQDAEYWLRLIHSFARDSADKTAPVIIALNKFDAAPFKLNRNALIEKYPFIVGFVETDCDSALGIAALHDLLADTIAAMPIIHHKFKRAWWDIKEALEAQTCNYLPYSHFQDICAKHQETDPSRQRFLADVFHALGVALNYGNDPRLRDATVLKPHWVTDGIYKLLVKGVPEDGKARLTMEAVREMLPDDSDQMRLYLVELMLRFNLAFPLRRRADQWLVPQRLPEEQPDLRAFWADPAQADATRLRYVYSVLPEGLLPRFIARTYPLSEAQEADDGGAPDLPRWVSGVLLANGEARALVRVDGEERQIVVTVIGGASDKLELLGVIQADFDTIHGDFKNLNPRAEIEVGAVGASEWMRVATLDADERRDGKTWVATDAGSIQLDTRATLNLLSNPAARVDGWRPRVFISYSSRDARAFAELEILLKPMHKTHGLLETWSDRCITPGAEWDKQIRAELERADVVLMLVSRYFLATDYITDIEITRALARAEAGQCLLVSVILENCGWEEMAFGKYLALPAKAKAILDYKPQRKGWEQVRERLHTLLKGLCDTHKAERGERGLAGGQPGYRKA